MFVRFKLPSNGVFAKKNVPKNNGPKTAFTPQAFVFKSKITFFSGKPLFETVDEKLNTISALNGVPKVVLEASHAKIFIPPRHTMQSVAKTHEWKVDITVPNSLDKWNSPLMGWTASQDPFTTLRNLFFPTKEEAIQFAEEWGIKYEVLEEEAPKVAPKSYSDNFAFKKQKKLKL